MVDQFLILVIAFFFSFLNSFIAYRFGFFKPLTKGKLSVIHFREVAWAFVLFLGIQILVVPISVQLWLWFVNGSKTTLSSLNQETLSWINIASIFLAFVALIAFYQFFDPRSKNIVWGQSKRPLKSFLLGVFSWLVCYPIITTLGQIVGIIVSLTFQVEPVDQTAVKYLKQSMENPYFFWTLSTVIVFIVPILEELLFRGYLQTWLKNYWNQKIAIVFTSIIFALFHFSFEQRFQNIELLTALFAMSCFLGYIFEREKSLWAPIGLHMIFNMVSVFAVVWEQM